MPARADSLAEVVVTARQRREVLQNVPLSITAFSQAQLRDANVQDIEDIALLTPGVTTYSLGAQYQTTTVIRGMAQQPFTGLGDNNVSVFFDGAYLFNSSAIDLSLLGIDRVEVVKGPLSALYGRDAYAGAINYVSTRPNDQLHATLSATGGNDGRADAKGEISGPLIKDVLSAHAAFSYSRFDGTYHDPVTDQRAGGYDRKDGLFSLHYTPTGKIDVLGTVYYGHDTFAPSPESFVPDNCADGFAYCGKVQYSAPQIPNTSQAGGTGNSRDVLHLQLNASIDFGFAQLTSITSYNDDRSKRFQTLEARDDGFSYNLVPGPGSVNLITNEGYRLNNSDYSQELRLSSRSDQRFRWRLGVYYFNASITNDVLYGIGPSTRIPAGQAPDIFFLFLPLLTPNGQPSGTPTLAKTRQSEASGFIGADFDITPKLTISAEVRQSGDHQREDTKSNLVLPGVAEPAGPPVSDSTQPTNGRVTLNYKLQRHVLLYASAANGTKTGGFNVTATFPADRPYGAQTNWTYEVGAKTSFLNNRLQLNGDVFHFDESGLQLNAPSSDPDNPADVIKNFGGDRSTGVELDFAAAPLPGLRLTGGATYTDPRFDGSAYDYSDVAICGLISSCSSRLTTVNGVSAIKLQGLHTPYESNFTFNLSASYEHLLTGAWSWFARGDYRYSSAQYGSVIDIYDYGPTNVFNASVGVHNGPYTIRAWAKNLTDDRTPTFVFTYVNIPLTSQPYAYLPDGRTFGATVEYSF